MKKSLLTITLLIIISFSSLAQTEKDIISQVTKVTVYPKGSQMESESSFQLEQGKYILNFKNLSPFIFEQSIRVEGTGKFTILNVQLHNDYLNELEKSKEINDLNDKIDQLQNKIEDEQTAVNILNEKIEFLKANKDITGKEQSVNPEIFKSLNSIYGDNYEKYTLDQLNKQRLIKGYKKEVEKLKNQLNSINTKVELPSGVITVTLESKQAQSIKMRIIYLVDNASWFPTYDLRFSSVEKPINISFKANISQNSGVDWKNVDLVLSTAKTNISAQIPALYTNYLEFYKPNYMESALQGRMSGINVLSNTAINRNSGSPGSSNDIKIRGYSSGMKEVPLYIVDGQAQEDIASINPDDIESMEVLKDASSTSIYGSSGANGVVVIKTKKDRNVLPQSIIEKNEISNEYIVESKQSVTSDSKNNTIAFKGLDLNATYEYHAIPKLSKNVYLIARVSDWNKADLMDGEANIYFENSYIGKSVISTQQFSDTFDISFGVDNNIKVNRDKIKDFAESQFIGSNIKETFAWKLTVRNNKTNSVKVKLFDQVPVSSTKDIEVETLDLSGGSMNKNTGKVTWAIELKPNETKQVILKYQIKYPKDKTVVVE